MSPNRFLYTRNSHNTVNPQYINQKKKKKVRCSIVGMTRIRCPCVFLQMIDCLGEKMQETHGPSAPGRTEGVHTAPILYL